VFIENADYIARQTCGFVVDTETSLPIGESMCEAVETLIDNAKEFVDDTGDYIGEALEFDPDYANLDINEKPIKPTTEDQFEQQCINEHGQTLCERYETPSWCLAIPSLSEIRHSAHASKYCNKSATPGSQRIASEQRIK